MGFPRGFTAAPRVSKATRRELLGQAMDLNSLMWVLAACRAWGLRQIAKLQTGEKAGSRGRQAISQSVWRRGREVPAALGM